MNSPHLGTHRSQLIQDTQVLGATLPPMIVGDPSTPPGDLMDIVPLTDKALNALVSSNGGDL